MRSISVKLRLAAVFMAFCLAAALFVVPAHAEADISTTRHSVVYLEVGIENDIGEWVGMFSGTGFFIGDLEKNPEYLITNHHVVEEYINGGKGERVSMVVDSDSHIHVDDNIYKMNLDSSFVARTRIKVYFDASNFIQASVVDFDNVKDLAVLRLDEPTGSRSALPLEIPDDSIAGKSVYAVGFPGLADNQFYNPTSLKGENDSTITKGAVSRLTTVTGSGVKVVQTDTDISGGNSGGPLINDNGDVVGICRGSVWNADMNTITYAINAVELKGILDRNNIPYVLGPVQKGIPLWIILVAGGALLLIIIIVIIIIAVSSSNKKKRLAEQQAQQQAQQQMQMQMQQLQQQQQQANMMNVGSQVQLKPGDTGLRIEGLAGAMAGKRVMIKLGSSVVIGRNANMCNVTVPDNTPGVSSKHCEIWLENGTLYIKDLGSSHGTFISPGIRVEPHVPTPVKEGTIFWLGTENQKFTISMKR